MAFVADKDVANGHAQAWNPELKPQVEASRPSAAEGLGAAVSACEADACNRVSGPELSGEERAAHAKLVREARGKELDA